MACCSEGLQCPTGCSRPVRTQASCPLLEKRRPGLAVGITAMLLVSLGDLSPGGDTKLAPLTFLSSR